MTSYKQNAKQSLTALLQTTISNEVLPFTLRENWPAMYKDIRHYAQTSHPKPGTLWTWGGTNGARIINLFVQEGAEGHKATHGGKATLSNLAHCLKALREYCPRNINI